MRRLLSVLVLIALAALAGCINYEEHVQIQKDGSGTLTMHMAMDRHMIDQMQTMAEQFGESDSDPLEDVRSDLNRDKIESQFKETGSRLKLTKYDEQVTDDAYVWDLAISFPHYDDLKDFDMGDGESGHHDSDGPGQFTYEKQPDGTWLYRRGMDEGAKADIPGSGGAMDQGDSESAEAGESPGMDEEDADGGDWESVADEDSESADEESAEMGAGGDSEDVGEGMEEFGKAMEQMGQMMQAMTEAAQKSSLTFTVTFPGKIVESNATRVEGNTATWEYKLDDLEGEQEPVMTARIKP